MPDRKIRICFVIQYLSIGGIETRMLKLLSHLNREIYDPVLLCIEDTGLQAEAFKATGVPIKTSDGLRSVNRAVQFLELMRFLASFRFRRFDAVMSFLPTSQPFENWLAKYGCRPGGFIFGLVVNFRMGRDKDWKTRERLAYQIVAVSNGVVKTLVDPTAAKSKIRVIYNGVDIECFSRKKYRHINRSDFGLPDNVFLVVSLARLAQQKRYDVLVKSAALLKQMNVETHFVVGGQDRLDGRFQQWIKEADVEDMFTYLGVVNNVPHLLSVCDAMVLTSDNEGCPNSLLEGMAMKLPSVVTKSGAEEFIIDGITGYVALLNDAEAIARYLSVLANNRDLRLAMGAAAHEWVTENASLKSMLINYEDLIEESAGGFVA